MDRLQPVRSRNEQHARKVERQIQVMVGKGVVLGWVEHFEQSRGGITAKIRAHFVQLIQQDNRVAAFDTPEGLDDAPWQSSNISSPVTADFGLIAHAAERDTGEF